MKRDNQEIDVTNPCFRKEDDMASNASSSENMVWKVMRNKFGYTDEEIEQLRNTKWAARLPEIFSSPNWIKVEMVKTNRCSVGFKQGDALYFNIGGMLISRKAPPAVCPHAIAALSPAFYACLDRLSRGADPKDIVIDHVSCTDPGFDHKGLGNNTMRITFEPMPISQRLRDTWSALPYMFHRSSDARGPDPGGLPKSSGAGAPVWGTGLTSGQRPTGKASESAVNFLTKCPLTQDEQSIFLQSDKRIKRISGIDRYKDALIVVEVVKSDACIAGHGVGERIYFDAMGRLLTDKSDKPICIRLLNKIWYRLVILLDRIADESDTSLADGTFRGELPEVRMSCYGASFPFGDCGQILMSISMEGLC
jgi:uncharacterized repeat protein (TIGR04076 family)